MFWTDSAIEQSREPLRQNRWYIDFGYDQINNHRFALKECSKPSYEITSTEHRLVTHYLKLPGVLKWKPIDIKYVSTVGPNNISNLAGAFRRFTEQLGYISPSSGGGHQQISKQNSKNLNIYQIDENGIQIENWSLYNCWISSVNYGALTYENEGFVDVSCTLQYDWAQLVENTYTDLTGSSPGFP